MIRAADLVRFCNTTMSIAGGDLDKQMEAWNVDKDELLEFMTQWSNHQGQLTMTDPRVILVALFSGFELGYRSCAEAGNLESAPDAIDFDETDRRHD